MLIGGQWRSASDGSVITTLCPSTGQPAGTAPSASLSDVNDAIMAARNAFPIWSGMSQPERNKVLFRIAALIREHADEMAKMVCLEHGTPYNNAFGVCMGAAERFEWSANAALRIKGDEIPVPNKEGGDYGLREFMEEKLVCVNYA